MTPYKNRRPQHWRKWAFSVSDAVRMMLIRVAAEKAVPFEVRLPNPTTEAAMRSLEHREGERFNSAEALFDDLGM